jgi:hypothetical protein
VGNLDKPVFKSPRQFTRLRELSRIHMTLVGGVEPLFEDLHKVIQDMR